MDHTLLIQYITEAAKKAEANLEGCNAGCRTFIVPQVRVIGEERLKSVTTLVDKSHCEGKTDVCSNFWGRRTDSAFAIAAILTCFLGCPPRFSL